MPNHLLGTDPAELPLELVADAGVAAELRGRIMIGRRADVLPVECVVRGYLAGSGWKEYVATGAVCGIELPPGSARRPSARADLHAGMEGAVGTHDRTSRSPTW